MRIEELDVPEGVRLVISRRLQRLSENTQKVLSSAAVIGRRFNFQLLEAVGEVDAERLIEAMEEAERAHLITSGESGREVYFTFNHALIRQTLLGELSVPRRQRYHLKISRAMEQLYSHQLEDKAADLAHHLYQAGPAADLEKTIYYLKIAADHALAANAFEEALRVSESALTLLRPEQFKSATRAQLLYQRGRGFDGLGKWEEAQELWKESLEIFEALDEAEWIVRVAWNIAAHLGWRGRHQELIEISQRSLKVLEKHLTIERCKLVGWSGNSWSQLGNYAAGKELLEQAESLARQMGDEQLIGDAFAHRSALAFYHLLAHQTIEMATAAVQRLTNSPWDRASALAMLEWGLFLGGRANDAAGVRDELLAVATRVGHLGSLWISSRLQGLLDLIRTANLDRFEEFARRDLEMCRQSGNPWFPQSYGWLGLRFFWSGEWEKALENFELGARYESSDFASGLPSALLLLGHAYMGNRDQFFTLLEQKRDLFPKAGKPSIAGSWALVAGTLEGASLLGARQEAASLYSLVAELLKVGTVIQFDGWALFEMSAGIAAACGSRWSEAEEHYQRALRQAMEIPHRIAQNDVRRWYASMLIDRNADGDHERAGRLLGEAAEGYQQIGMPRHQQLALALLHSIESS